MDILFLSVSYCRNGTYLSGTPYGEGSGHIWLDNVKCAGTEVSLLDCEHNAWDDEDCGHSEDVTIRCGKNFTNRLFVNNINCLLVFIYRYSKTHSL